MAGAWSGYASPGDAGPWRIGVTADVATLSDSQVRLDASEIFDAQWGYEANSQYHLLITDGSATAYDSGLTNSSIDIAYGQQQTVATASVTLARGDEDRAVTVTGYYALTGGYGNSSCTATVNVTVPAKPKYPPAAPTIAGSKRVAGGGASVRVNIAGGATLLQVRRRETSSGAVSTFYDGAAGREVADSAKTACQYSARDGNSDGWSAWSAWSDSLPAMGTAGKPTLVSPASGAVVNSNQQVTFSWSHVAADRSDQTKATVSISTDGGSTWTNHDVSGASQSLTLSLGGVSGACTWLVRTAGASGELGPWSDPMGFTASTGPKVTITSPAGDTVDALPVAVAWTVTDSGGTQARATVTATAGSASDSRAVSSATGASMLGGKAVPDGATVTITVTVTDTAGLTGSASKAVTVKYAPPEAPSGTFRAYPAQGYVTGTVRSTQGGIATEYLSVTRDGVTIADRVASGATVIDRLAPLDVPLTYAVTAHAASGATRTASATLTLRSRCNGIVNYGSGLAEVALIAKNMRVEEEYEPEAELTQVNGRPLPVAMYGEHDGVTGSIEGVIDWIDGTAGTSGADAELAAWREALAWRGDVILRLPRGERRRVRMTGKVSRGGTYGKADVSASWTEVDGGVD